jgi:hypothetical protein
MLQDLTFRRRTLPQRSNSSDYSTWGNAMESQSIYVPILKGKRGEFHALGHLRPETKAALFPLLEIPPLKAPKPGKDPKEAAEKNLGRMVKELALGWAGGGPLMIDTSALTSTNTADVTVINQKIYGLLQEKGLQVIPVVWPDLPGAPYEMYREMLTVQRAEVAVRVSLQRSADLTTQLQRLLRALECQPNRVHLVLDLGAIAPGTARLTTLAASAVLKGLPMAKAWRSLTLAGTAFPETLVLVKAWSSASVERTEWLVWKAIRATGADLPRVPRFGDYAIAHPNHIETDGPLFPSGNIRYTATDSWTVLKGVRIKDNGTEQFRDLARDLMKRPEYAGPAFSWGDEAIKRCADGEGTPGSSTTWRAIGTNHHLEMVVDQLSKLS